MAVRAPFERLPAHRAVLGPHRGELGEVCAAVGAAGRVARLPRDARPSLLPRLLSLLRLRLRRLLGRLRYTRHRLLYRLHSRYTALADRLLGPLLHLLELLAHLLRQALKEGEECKDGCYLPALARLQRVHEPPHQVVVL